MSAADLGLTIAYWLHMLATVIWIGSLAALALVVLPAAARSLGNDPYINLLAALQHRLDPIAWFCLLLLAGTGLFQMSASPSYQGFLAFENIWSVAILIKHLVFLFMIGVNALMTWVILPGLHRLAILRKAKESRNELNTGVQVVELERLQRQSVALLRLNLLLAVLALALTAIARVS
jgi:uncharacterized membrane protein